MSWAYFNPRGPCGPRLHMIESFCISLRISILAVLADRDGSGLKLDLSRKNNFNPRGPCGPRRGTINSANRRQLFQSSRSLRTATQEAVADKYTAMISILAVLADRDSSRSKTNSLNTDFNPRGPCGPRPCLTVWCGSTGRFQSSRSLRTAT